MTITAFDLKQITTNQDTSIQEINYNFRGATNLGEVTTLTALRYLNVAFNNLNHVKGIQQLQSLRHLDISHNHITSLEPISALTALISVNAGCNKIQSTTPLTNLSSLRALGLQNNDISQPSAVLLLSQLSSLQHIVLAGNQVCNLPNWKLGVIAALTCLQALDSLVMSQADRLAAQPYASTLQQLSAAEDQQCSKIRAGSDTGSTASAKSSSTCSKPTNNAQLNAQQVASAAAAGCPVQAAAVSSERISNIKDAAVLLPVITVPSLKPSTLPNKQQGNATNSPWSRATPQKEVFKQWYGNGSSGTAALTVRSDGSAALLWPDGSIAATLDAETGFDSAYRLLAMYRNVVGVAASFDSNGGFVQYPSGGLMLVWSKKDGSGTCYAPDGTVTHSFNSRRKALGLKGDIRQQLDQHYSIVFLAKTYELQVTFDCDGLQLGLSVLHGAQLPQQHAATARSMIGPSAAAAARTEDSTQEMLARARAVMAAEVACVPGDPVSASFPPVVVAASKAEPAVAACGLTTAAPSAASAGDGPIDDDMHALLARARALMAATNADLASQA